MNSFLKTHLQASNRKGAFFLFLLFIGLLIIDIYTRYFCFLENCNFNFYGAGLTQFKNFNFAFSLEVPSLVMYGLYFLLVVSLLAFGYTNLFRWQPWTQVAWICIFAGAAGNIGERIFLGYVRDFIRIGTGFINLGDVYIVLGVAYILWQSFKHSE